MEQTEFLEKNVFNDLKNMNDGFDEESIHYFSESDFETVLKQVEYFGIGVYGIKTYLNGKSHSDATHEDHNKKATDSKWYKKTFKTFKMGQSGLLYAATYKVSKKLLER